MEPPSQEIEVYSGPRYKLIGPKVKVVKVEKGLAGTRIHLRMGPVIMIWDTPVTNADIREGVDWLTLYTEVPINAQPESTSIQ